jgi:hypothetical protein
VNARAVAAVATAITGYVVLVLIPVVVATGGPPAPPALAALLGWQVLWLLIAVAVLVEARRPALSPQPAP